jgi:hypothetical protein
VISDGMSSVAGAVDLADRSSSSVNGYGSYPVFEVAEGPAERTVADRVSQALAGPVAFVDVPSPEGKVGEYARGRVAVP